MNARFVTALAFLSCLCASSHGAINEDPKPPKVCPPLLPSFDEVSGMRFRRIALNGLPMSAEKEQAKDESDETNEETYVDSLTLQLRHDTSDVYIPLQGGELALSAKRSITSEMWSEGSGGENPSDHVKFDRPFGYCWSSGIGATLRTESYTITTDAEGCASPRPSPYAYATDENGTTYRFGRATLSIPDEIDTLEDLEKLADDGELRAVYMPLPSNRTERTNFMNCLVAQYGINPDTGKPRVENFILKRKFGTKLTYDGQPAKVNTFSLDSEGKKKKTTRYHRLKRAEDRFGNVLTFQFNTGNNTLIPDEIIAVSGSGGTPRSIKITRGSLDLSSQVTKIEDPAGNQWHYSYESRNGLLSRSVPLLVSVKRPDGAITRYDYETDMAVDQAPRAPTNQEAPDRYFHVNLTKIVSNIQDGDAIYPPASAGIGATSVFSSVPWANRERITNITYVWDKTTKVEGLIPVGEPVTTYEIEEYIPYSARTKLVSETSVTDHSNTILSKATFVSQNGFLDTNYIKLKRNPNPETGEPRGATIEGGRAMDVTDANGVKRTIAYGTPTMINGKEIEELINRNSGPKAPYYIAIWTQCGIVHPRPNGQPGGQMETVGFDINANLSDSVVTDYSGNETSYEYGDVFKFTDVLLAADASWKNVIEDVRYASIFAKLDNLPLFSGRFNDPTKETRTFFNPLTNQEETATKEFAYYTSSGEIPEEIEDEDLALMKASPAARVMTKIKDAEGRVTTYALDQNTGNRLSETIKDTAGNVVKKTDFLYDSVYKGFLTTTTVHNAIHNNGVFSSQVTQNVPSLDGYGYVAKEIVDPSGLILETSHTYDANGNKLSTTDPRGHRVDFVYDQANRLVHTAFPDAGSGRTYLSTVYSPNGQKLFVRDELGRLTANHYDAAGRLTKTVRDMDAPTVGPMTNAGEATGADLVTEVGLYNGLGQPLESYDANGTKTVTAYDGLARPISITVDPSGLNHVTQMFYDGPHSGAWAFNTSGFKPTKTIDPRGYETLVEYDGRYLPVRTRKQITLSPASYALSVQKYDLLANVVEAKVYRDEANAASAKVTKTVYDALNRPTSVTDAFGTAKAATSTTKYTSTGAYWTKNAVFAETETDFDTAGRPIKEWQAGPAQGYINRSYLTHAFFGSPVVSKGYDNAGNLTSVTDQLGRVTTTAYDTRNRKTTQTSASHTYQLPGGGTSTVTPVVTWTYYKDGQVKTATDPRNTITTTAYDAANRPVTVTTATGLNEEATTTSSYDKNGNVVMVVDANGNKTKNLYDRANRLTKTAVNPVTGNPADPDDTPAAYDIVVKNGYDESGNLTLVTDGEEQQTAFAYDGLGRKTSVTWDPNKSAAKTDYFHFDALAQVSRVDAKGQVTEYGYDELLRNTLVTYVGRSEDNRVNDFDLVGNLKSVTYPNETTANQVLRGVTQTFDKLNRVTSEKSNGVTHNYTYDKGSNRLMVAYGITGRKIVSKYDAYNKLETCWDTTGSVSDASTYAGQSGDRRTDYVYDVNGSQVLKKLPNGQVTTTSYDKLNRAMVIETKDGSGALVSKFDYSQKGLGSLATDHPSGYDRMGNVCQVLETVPDNGAAGMSLRTVLNTYDRTYRLAVERRQKLSFSGSMRITGTTDAIYRYDKANNRSSRQQGLEVQTAEQASGGGSFPWQPVPGTFASLPSNLEERNVYVEQDPMLPWPVAPFGVTQYFYGDGENGYNANQLVQTVAETDEGNVFYVYDENGNRFARLPMALGLPDNYFYDYENRLVTVVLRTEEWHTYAYDHRTRRVLRDESQATGQATRLVFSGGLSVQEHGASGTISTSTLQVENIRGNDLGGGIGGMLYSLRGGNSSFNSYNSRGDVISQTDASGAVTWQAAYEAFGKRTQELGTNNDRQRANTKDEDPTGLLNEGMRYRDLETGSFLTRDPAGFVDGPNVYTYVRQNPWSKFDPRGLAEKRVDADGYEWKNYDHHKMPAQVARDSGFGPEAKAVFDPRPVNDDGSPNADYKRAKVMTQDHNGLGHGTKNGYNGEVTEELNSFMKGKGKAMSDIAGMSAKDQVTLANEFLDHINNGPNEYIRGFNEHVGQGNDVLRGWLESKGRNIVKANQAARATLRAEAGGAKIVVNAGKGVIRAGGRVICRGLPIVGTIAGGTQIAQGYQEGGLEGGVMEAASVGAGAATMGTTDVLRVGTDYQIQHAKEAERTGSAGHNSYWGWMGGFSYW